MKKVILLLFSFVIIVSSQAFSQMPGNDQSKAGQSTGFNPGSDSIKSQTSQNQFFSRPVPEQESGTIVLEFIGGTAGGAVGAVAGALITVPFQDVYHDGYYIMLASALVLGFDAGASGAITLIGNNDRVKGNFGAAALGSLIGDFASLAIVALGASTNLEAHGLLPICIAAGIAAPVAGSMIGYSLSRKWQQNYISNPNTGAIERKQAEYTDSFAGRLSFEGLSLSLKQNPYKIQPEAMTYLNLVNVKF